MTFSSYTTTPDLANDKVSKRVSAPGHWVGDGARAGWR